MGDTTYNHIYHETGSTGSVTQRLHKHAEAKPDLADTAEPRQEQPLSNEGIRQQPLPVQAEPGAGHGMHALRHAIADNLQSPSPAADAGTLTGGPVLALRLHAVTSQL